MPQPDTTDTIQAPYPHTPATTIAPVTRENASDRAPAHTQETHPSTTVQDATPPDPTR